jgi:hypothetical protein
MKNKKMPILSLTAVFATALMAFVAANGFATKTVEVTTSDKIIAFNNTTNFPTSVGSAYLATTMDTGTSTGVVTKLSKGSAITDQVTLGGSYLAAVTFTADVTDETNAYLEFTAGVQNLTGLAVSYYAKRANSTTLPRYVLDITSLDGATTKNMVDYKLPLYPDDNSVSTNPTGQGIAVVGSFTVRIFCGNFKAGDMLASNP